MITLGLNVTDRAIIANPETKKFRLFVSAQLAAFKRQLAPMAVLLSLTDLESAFDGKAPSYVVEGWKRMLASIRDLNRDLARWETDEKETDHGNAA